MTTRILGGLAALVLLGGLFVAPAAQAHNGNNCGLSSNGTKLEGECYSTPDAACDPDADGEHTQVTPAGTEAFLPSAGCGLNFASVAFANPGNFTVVSQRVSGASGTFTFTAVLKVDGAACGSVTYPMYGQSVDTTVTMTTACHVSAGSHSLRFQFNVGPNDPTYLNYYLDYLGFSPDSLPPSCTTPPTNSPPSQPGIGGADGYADGTFGWAGSDFAYSFTGLAATDPNGDPIHYTWNWGDGKTGSGLDADHAYAGAGAKKVTLVATDDPSARNLAGCPSLSPMSSTSAVFTFTVTDDWVAILVNPTDGTSCVDDIGVPVPGANVMALTCTLQASVDTAQAPATAAAKVCYWVDGKVASLCATKDPYKAKYDSTKFQPGSHDLQACAYAKNDKFKRGEAGDFCSDTYTYLNI